LHKEFGAKIEEHGVPEALVRRSLAWQAVLASYEYSGRPRLALWSPETELLVIATLPGGLILNAFPVRSDRALTYMSDFEEVRWLRL
jgi:hypothetical protein